MGQLANRILAMGTDIGTERLSYRAFQKNFGRSVMLRAPGAFVLLLRHKAENACGKVTEKCLDDNGKTFGAGARRSVRRGTFAVERAEERRRNMNSKDMLARIPMEVLRRRFEVRDFFDSSGRRILRYDGAEGERFRILDISDIRQAARSILAAHGAKRAWLFGSYARGTAKLSSDVDFIVEFPTGSGEKLSQLLRRRRAIELEKGLESVIELRVDVVDYVDFMESEELRRRASANIYEIYCDPEPEVERG